MSKDLSWNGVSSLPEVEYLDSKFAGVGRTYRATTRTAKQTRQAEHFFPEEPTSSAISALQKAEPQVDFSPAPLHLHSHSIRETPLWGAFLATVEMSIHFWGQRAACKLREFHFLLPNNFLFANEQFRNKSL